MSKEDAAADDVAREEELYAIAKAFNDYAGVRSFLSRDVEGRVCRLDSFSKIFAPGMRLGWITANSIFADRYLRVVSRFPTKHPAASYSSPESFACGMHLLPFGFHRILSLQADSTTQSPNGVGQSIIASYLSTEQGWGVGGFLRWIYGIRIEYERKRDFFCDHLYAALHTCIMPWHLLSCDLHFVHTSLHADTSLLFLYSARLVKPEYAHAVPAMGGMFNQIVVNVAAHPRYKKHAAATKDGAHTNTVRTISLLGREAHLYRSDSALIPFLCFSLHGSHRQVELMSELFELFLTRKLLVLPASLFKASLAPSALDDKCNFFRATFAGDTEQIEKALEIFGIVIEEWFGHVTKGGEGTEAAAM